VVPAAMVITGWNYFWCRSLDAAMTKATGAALLFGCISAFLSLIFGTLEVSGKAFRAGGYAGDFLANEMAEYLNRTGSIIGLLTLIFLAIIMTTQFSFGRFFGVVGAAAKEAAIRAFDSLRDWREERRREKQRREVIAKHTKKAAASDAPPPRLPAPPPPIVPGVAAAAKPAKKRI